MRIVKRFNDGAFESLKRGVIRIGSLAYYRRIESSERIDAEEGPLGAIIHAREGDVQLSAEQLNGVMEAVGARYRLNRLGAVLRKGATLKIDSDVNVFVFCTSIDAAQDETLSTKFGQNIVEIVDTAGFSKLISRHLHQKVLVEKCLNLNGNADRIGGGYEPVSYGKKTPREMHELKGEAVNLSGVFVKPRRYEEEREFRFVWIPLWLNDSTGCDLPIDFKYLDLDIPEIWQYLRCV